MQAISYQPVMQRLAKLAAVVGISPPGPDDRLAEYAARILNAIDPDDEEQDDEVRFAVLVLLNSKGKT